MSRAQLTSTVEQNSAGAAAPVVGGKNFVINGGMDFNQRGSAAVSATNAYCLDRWYVSGFGSGANNSFGQIGTGDGPANFKNYLRYGQGAGTTSTNFFLSQSLETLNVIPLQGKTVTFSFWYRTATAFTGSWTAGIYTSTATDSNINTLWYYGNTVASVSLTNSSGWSYAKVTGIIPSNANSLAVGFSSTTNIVANATFDVTGVQLEQGSVATPFSRAGGTLQGELALCQRYYEVSSGNTIFSGNVTSGVTYYTTASFKVTKRTSPSVTFTSQGFTGFASGAPTSYQSGNTEIWCGNAANSTTNGGFFQFTYVASAEL